MSRKKKDAKRSGAAGPLVEPPAIRPRRRVPWTWIAVPAFALGIGTFLWWRSSPRGSARPAKTVDVPNPDTTGFEPPVQEIIAQTRQAVLDQPDSMIAWGKFATVLDAHFMYKEAERAYRRALEISPNDQALSYNLAIVLETLGSDPKESLGIYRKFADMHPDFPPVYVRIGKILAVQGEMKAAVESYRTALALDPRLTIARRSLGQALIALDDAAAALPELLRVAKEDSDDGPTQAALAQVYTRMGDEARAAEAMQRGRELPDRLRLPDPVNFLVRKESRSARVASNRAADRIREADYAGAVEDLQIVLRTHAQDPAVHERIADAYKHLGQTALAEQHLAEAKRLRGGQ